MAFTNRTKISEYDATAANNINLGTAASPAARLGEYGVDADAEAMRPSDTNGALRELMAHLKAMDVGTNPLTTPNLGEPTADVIGLNTSYSEDGNEAQGSIFWNPDELTANLVQNGTILQIGQEIQINVRNSTGSDIADGSAVMATGTLGASGRITVGLMDASSAANAKMFIGIATETITAGGDGKVTWFGKVRDIDTSGFTQPSILWCDPATAGGLTETQPSAPNAKLAVAYVIYSATAQNGGTIFVRGTPGQLLSECHDVQISGTPADNELLAYDATTGAFINQTAAEAGLQSVLAEGAFVDGDKTKLDGIETGADVTDATNVEAAGAVMDGDYADGTYLVGTATPGTYTQVTDNSTDWNTAYGWGDHSTAGYITSGLQDGGNVSTGLYFQDNANLRVGTGTDLQISSDGTDVEALLGSNVDFNIQASSTGFTYLSKSGSASGDTPVVGGAQNTYALAATTGGGVGFGLRSPNGNGVSLNATTLSGRYSDVTDGSEDTRLEVTTYVAGTPTTVATFRGDQASTIPGSLSVTGALTQNGNDVLTTASGVALYGDTTANFTGTLQNGGNTVLTTATGATTGKAIAMAIVFG